MRDLHFQTRLLLSPTTSFPQVLEYGGRVSSVGLDDAESSVDFSTMFRYLNHEQSELSKGKDRQATSIVKKEKICRNHSQLTALWMRKTSLIAPTKRRGGLYCMCSVPRRGRLKFRTQPRCSRGAPLVLAVRRSITVQLLIEQQRNWLEVYAR